MSSSIPLRFAANEHQSKAHSYSCTDHQVYTRKGNAIKSKLFLDWKIFPLPLSGGGKCFWGKNQSRKEQLVEKNPRHVTSGWAEFLGRVTSWLLLALPLLTARPSCLLTGGRHSPDGSAKIRNEFLSRRHVAQEHLRGHCCTLTKWGLFVKPFSCDYGVFTSQHTIATQEHFSFKSSEHQLLKA